MNTEHLLDSILIFEIKNYYNPICNINPSFNKVGFVNYTYVPDDEPKSCK